VGEFNSEKAWAAPIEVTATPARHGPPLSRPIVGEVVGFGLRWEGQENGALWISGDTVPFGGLRRVSERMGVGVAVLHLGRVQFDITGPVRYSMTLEGSLQLVDRLKPHTAVPVHFEGWSHFQERRAAIEERLRSFPEDLDGRYRLLSSSVPTPIAPPVE
jgi:L-ascorbate metabolism protein UlaG (beta-lactamase superfamily)